MNQGSFSLERPLILKHELGAKLKCITGALRFELQVTGIEYQPEVHYVFLPRPWLQGRESYGKVL